MHLDSITGFLAGFYRAHAAESMTRLLAFLWFCVGTAYIFGSMWQRRVPDFPTLGLISTNCLTCLGLRNKSTATPAPVTP